MENAPTRLNSSNIIAACIVGASLIIAALIVAHRPVAAVGTVASVSTLSAKPVVAPPIAQASVQEQVRAQILAAPALHTFQYQHKVYTLSDVNVKQVIYSAKNDTFALFYDWVWQPAMPSDGPRSSGLSLNNDGYGHYYGTAVLSAEIGGSGQNADVTIK